MYWLKHRTLYLTAAVLMQDERANGAGRGNGRIAEKLISAVKVNCCIPDSKLSRATGMHAVSSSSGAADVDETVSLQLTSPAGLIFLHVRHLSTSDSVFKLKLSIYGIP